jgi:putative transposase
MLKVVGEESVRDEMGGRSLLDEIAREGERRMLVAALETEVGAYLDAHREERDDEGRALVVRNGKGRTRKIPMAMGANPFGARSSVAPRMMKRNIAVSTTSLTRPAASEYPPGEWAPKPLAAKPLESEKPSFPLAMA